MLDKGVQRGGKPEIDRLLAGRLALKIELHHLGSRDSDSINSRNAVGHPNAVVPFELQVMGPQLFDRHWHQAALLRQLSYHGVSPWLPI